MNLTNLNMFNATLFKLDTIKNIMIENITISYSSFENSQIFDIFASKNI
jgi:hypothetical protein